LNNNELEIIICTDKNKEKDIVELLRHETIHAYDYIYHRYDFNSCDGLASTEVRAAREGECNSKFPIQWLKEACVRNHAIRSTANIYPNSASKCVNTVFYNAMKDLEPQSQSK